MNPRADPLRAVCQDPGDDTLRLVFADWLDDQGTHAPAQPVRGAAMSRRAVLRRAVCQDPGDDTLRLVFADWLDDQGEHARAELVRVQCALAALPPADDRRLDLLARQEDLLAAHEAEWLGEW